MLANLGGKAKTAKPLGTPAPIFPDRIGHIWADFCEIIEGEASNGMAPSGITWTGLQAWSSFMGRTLQPWEARLLVRLGSMRAEIIAEQAKTEQQGNGKGEGADRRGLRSDHDG